MGVAFAAALSRRAMAALPAGSAVLAVAGKARRGLPGVRLMAVYAMAAGPLVGQKGVRWQGNCILNFWHNLHCIL